MRKGSPLVAFTVEGTLKTVNFDPAVWYMSTLTTLLVCYLCVLVDLPDAILPT